MTCLLHSGLKTQPHYHFWISRWVWSRLTTTRTLCTSIRKCDNPLAKINLLMKWIIKSAEKHICRKFSKGVLNKNGAFSCIYKYNRLAKVNNPVSELPHNVFSYNIKWIKHLIISRDNKAGGMEKSLHGIKRELKHFKYAIKGILACLWSLLWFPIYREGKLAQTS